MCFTDQNHERLPAPRSAGPRSNGGQHRNQGTSHPVQHPPPPPPPPPASVALPRAGRSHGPSNIQSVKLKSRPGPSSAGGHSSKQISNADVLEAVQAVSTCLNNTNVKYAIVGGAGLAALGSGRVTDDVDFVVDPPAQLKAAKDELRRDPRFSIDPETRHTTFTTRSGCAIDIEALSFPGTFKARFDRSTQLLTVREGVHVLNALLYLESKCGAVYKRSQEAKRRTDSRDIQFILRFMIQSGIRASPSEVPSADSAFIARFDEENPGGTKLFHQVGLA